MAFIQNDGDIILDAVLTDLGRQRMSRGDGSFKITKFSLSDDEINYANYEENTGIGNTPILEAMTNNSSTLKSFLVTYSSNNLLYLPVLKLNDVTPANQTIPTSDATVTSGTGMFFITADQATNDKLNEGGTNRTSTSGYINGAPVTSESETHTNWIRIDQGIDNNARTENLPADLKETTYEIVMDSRFLKMHSKERQTLRSNYTDDDGFDYYYVSREAESTLVTEIPNIASSILSGSVGTKIEFAAGASTQIADSTFLFDQLGGGSFTIDNTSYHYIDTTIRVKGMTTGYSINVPVRILKYTS